MQSPPFGTLRKILPASSRFAAASVLHVLNVEEMDQRR
jgi:hypothetical protein